MSSIMGYKITTSALAAAMLTGCGGGGGADSNGSNMGGTPSGPSQIYLTIDDTTAATSRLGGAISNGTTVEGTTGTITHNTQSFVASGVSGAQMLGMTSGFNLSAFDFATDVALDTSRVAIVGVTTATADMPTSGLATYSGEFRGNLGTSGSPTFTTLNWDADIQVGFAGNGDVDMTFAGSGSSVIDTIRIQNATISGNTFSGGTLTTSIGGAPPNNVTGTSVDMNGAFFGYDETLTIPAEVGGAMASSGGGNTLNGVFITSSQP